MVYHVLIGRKFLHIHNIIPCSHHQCIKSHWKGKEIFIPTTKTPFKQNDVNYIEPPFIEDPAKNGETTIARSIGIPLPK